MARYLEYIKRNRPVFVAIFLFVILIPLMTMVLIAVSSLIFSRSDSNYNNRQNPPPPEAVTEGNELGGEIEPVPETDVVGEVLTYSSQALGIEFDYYSTESAKIVEEGNIIYVYPREWDSADYKEGQWVEVFQKDRNTAFEIAIKGQTQGGYDACMINAYTELWPNYNYPSSYTAYATYEQSGSMINPSTSDKCNEEYQTFLNGNAYFLADSNHPDKFLYLSIGQYLLHADSERTIGWQDTIRFVVQ